MSAVKWSIWAQSQLQLAFVPYESFPCNKWRYRVLRLPITSGNKRIVNNFQSYGDQRMAFQGGTRVTVWNEQEQTRHLAFLSQSVLLHTAEHTAETACLFVLVEGDLQKWQSNLPFCFPQQHLKNLGLYWRNTSENCFSFCYTQFLIKVNHKNSDKSFLVEIC